MTDEELDALIGPITRLAGMRTNSENGYIQHYKFHIMPLDKVIRAAREVVRELERQREAGGANISSFKKR